MTGIIKSISETIIAGGPVMIPIIIISLIVWTLIIKKMSELNKERINREIFNLSEVPSIGRASPSATNEVLMSAFTEKIIKLVSAGKEKEALNLSKATSGILPKATKTLLENRTKTKESLLKSVKEVLLSEYPRLTHSLPTIGILASVSPLLGLLGTVTGMVSTFNSITLYGTGDPQSLARGISEALITTQSGLLVAIPVLFFYDYLTKRVDNIMSSSEKNINRLVNFLIGGNLNE